MTNRAADTISILDTEKLEVVGELECEAFPIRVAFTPDGERALVTCAESGDLAIYDAAKREARRLGISMAELLRRSLRNLLPVDESKPWMRYAGMVESGDPESSRNVDRVVYGQEE